MARIHNAWEFVVDAQVHLCSSVAGASPTVRIVLFYKYSLKKMSEQKKKKKKHRQTTAQYIASVANQIGSSCLWLVQNPFFIICK